MMSNTLRAAVLAATAAFSSLPALADPAWECRIDQHAENGNWIMDQIVVARKDGKAFVLDGLIQHHLGVPVEAKIDTDNASRTTYSWSLKTKSSSNQNVTMRYRLTIMKGDLSASAVAAPGRYAQTFTARGRCRKVKG